MWLHNIDFSLKHLLQDWHVLISSSLLRLNKCPLNVGFVKVLSQKLHEGKCIGFQPIMLCEHVLKDQFWSKLLMQVLGGVLIIADQCVPRTLNLGQVVRDGWVVEAALQQILEAVTIIDDKPDLLILHCLEFSI